ncbi:hypothetical protein LJB81_03125 [Desulfovibrio sp. OttesenSCG-928-M14]|nr:hypothetical protein [Desulfovibrio sp. OttesenSCG-928-M14]
MYYAKNWCDDHCGAGSYDAWFRRQVEAGLKEAEEGKLLPFSHTVAKLKAMGFNVD